MTRLLVPAPSGTDAGLGEMTHVYCCDPDVGLCGTDLTDLTEVSDDAVVDCVVRAELDGQPCARCR
jgi:hypothetical protein